MIRIQKPMQRSEQSEPSAYGRGGIAAESLMSKAEVFAVPADRSFRECAIKDGKPNTDLSRRAPQDSRLDIPAQTDIGLPAETLCENCKACKAGAASDCTEERGPSPQGRGVRQPPSFRSDEGESLSQPRSLIARLRRIKHIEIYLAAAIIAVMVLIFFSSIGGSKKSTGTSQNLTNAEDSFVQEMEQKLVKTLSQIKGAGNVSAMVTAVGTSTLEIAYNIDEKTITQGGGTASTSTTTVTKTPLLVGGQPFVLSEVKPKLKGILIVASGASDVKVRLNLLLAVEALVSDPTVKIEILTHK